MFASLKDKQGITYRFALISNDKELKSLKKKFNEIVLSFNRIKDEDLDLLSPPRIKIISTNSRK